MVDSTSDYRDSETKGGRSGSATDRRCELRFCCRSRLENNTREACLKRLRWRRSSLSLLRKSKLGASSFFLQLGIREDTCRSKFVFFQPDGGKRFVMSRTGARNRKSSRHQNRRQWTDSRTATIVLNWVRSFLPLFSFNYQKLRISIMDLKLCGCYPLARSVLWPYIVEQVC